MGRVEKPEKEQSSNCLLPLNLENHVPDHNHTCHQNLET